MFHGDANARLSMREEALAGMCGGLLSCWNHPFEVCSSSAWLTSLSELPRDEAAAEAVLWGSAGFGWARVSKSGCFVAAAQQHDASRMTGVVVLMVMCDGGGDM